MKITQPQTERGYRRLVTNTSAGGTSIVPPAPLVSTDVQAIINEIQTEIAGAGAANSMAPTVLLAAEIFLVPDRRQSLFSAPITFGAGSGISLGSDSAFIEVH